MKGLANRGSQFLDLGMKGLFNAALGGLGGAFGGGFSLGNFNLGGLASYAGGGYTGDGARSGGLDGMGGFPAMLHPNETVVDHTAGQGIGGGVTFQVTINAPNSTRDAAPSIAEAVRKQLPDAIAKFNANPYRRG